MKLKQMRFGDLKGGEKILTPDGSFGVVGKAYDVHTPQSMYRLTDSSGNTIEASGNHLWYVVTDFNRELHRKRMKDGARIGKTLSDDSIKGLESIAFDERLLEMAIIDVLELLEVADSDNGEIHDVVIRTAGSIGHIAEETIRYSEDMELDEVSEVIRSYDANRLAKQLLSVFNIKNYRRKWKPLVGEVMTTEDIVNLDCDVWIPELNESKESSDSQNVSKDS